MGSCVACHHCSTWHLWALRMLAMVSLDGPFWFFLVNWGREGCFLLFLRCSLWALSLLVYQVVQLPPVSTLNLKSCGHLLSLLYSVGKKSISVASVVTHGIPGRSSMSRGEVLGLFKGYCVYLSGYSERSVEAHFPWGMIHIEVFSWWPHFLLHREGRPCQAVLVPLLLIDLFCPF